jgi:hypothetical protein
MKNVDVEIYINQLIGFFEKNPNDLIDLIGDLQKNDFYNKLRECCERNYTEGKDIILSREQIVNVVLELKIPETLEVKPNDLERIVYETKFGKIILN